MQFLELDAITDVFVGKRADVSARVLRPCPPSGTQSHARSPMTLPATVPRCGKSRWRETLRITVARRSLAPTGDKVLVWRNRCGDAPIWMSEVCSKYCGSLTGGCGLIDGWMYGWRIDDEWMVTKTNKKCIHTRNNPDTTLRKHTH
jgi:hypothetical protein